MKRQVKGNTVVYNMAYNDMSDLLYHTKTKKVYTAEGLACGDETIENCEVEVYYQSRTGLSGELNLRVPIEHDNFIMLNAYHPRALYRNSKDPHFTVAVPPIEQIVAAEDFIRVCKGINIYVPHGSHKLWLEDEFTYEYPIVRYQWEGRILSTHHSVYDALYAATPRSAEIKSFEITPYAPEVRVVKGSSGINLSYFDFRFMNYVKENRVTANIPELYLNAPSVWSVFIRSVHPEFGIPSNTYKTEDLLDSNGSVIVLPSGFYTTGGGIFIKPEEANFHVSLLAERGKYYREAHGLPFLSNYTLSVPKGVNPMSPKLLEELHSRLLFQIRQSFIYEERRCREKIDVETRKKSIIELLGSDGFVLTTADSVRAGNCPVGTTDFMKRHGFESPCRGADILAHPKIDEILNNNYFIHAVIAAELKGEIGNDDNTLDQ